MDLKEFYVSKPFYFITCFDASINGSPFFLLLSPFDIIFGVTDSFREHKFLAQLIFKEIKALLEHIHMLIYINMSVHIHTYVYTYDGNIIQETHGYQWKTNEKIKKLEDRLNPSSYT